MTLPGPELLLEDLQSPSGPNLTISTPLIVAETERGVVNVPVPLRNVRDLRKYFGDRTTVSAAIWNWLTEYWRQGGGRVYLVRRVGPAAAAASHDFLDGTSAVAITVKMREKGAFGNSFSADIDVTGSNFQVKLYRTGTTDPIEDSGMVADGAAAAAWAAANSSWIDIIDGPGVDPAATGSAAALTAGADDLGNVTDTQTTAAVQAFPAQLGPGVYVLVGITNSSAQLIAAAEAKKHVNRIARADLPPDATVSAAATQLGTLRTSLNGDVIDPIVTPVNGPGLTPTVPSLLPGSVMRCACEAVNDRAGVSPNQPAAGRWGQPAKAGLTPARTYTDDERETLNDAGGNVIITVDGQTRLYGARTAADPATDPAGLRLGSARLRMWIAEFARFEAQETSFAEIDQGGVVLGELKGRIDAQIRSSWPRSIYFLEVTADVVEDEDQSGQYLVEITIEFQAAPDAERVRVTIARAVTEV